MSKDCAGHVFENLPVCLRSLFILFLFIDILNIILKLAWFLISNFDTTA